MLGDSIRRRRPPPRAPRPPDRPAGGRKRVSWAVWVGVALVVLGGSFLAGYLLATQVFFPRPETAGAGIPVPSLYWLDRQEAEAVLARAGLVTGAIMELPSLHEPAGRVLAQSPVPGQQLRAGAEVALAVSAGPPEVRVPPVAGLGRGSARSLLETAGFEVRLEQVRVAGVAVGAVTRTEPAAGTTVRLPATVMLMVNAGAVPEPEPAPTDPTRPDA